MVLLLGVGCSQRAVDAEITGFDACLHKCASTVLSFRFIGRHIPCANAVWPCACEDKDSGCVQMF